MIVGDNYSVISDGFDREDFQMKKLDHINQKIEENRQKFNKQYRSKLLQAKYSGLPMPFSMA